MLWEIYFSLSYTEDMINFLDAMGCQSVTERCLETEEGPAKAYQTYYKAGEPDIRILKEWLFSQEKAQKIKQKFSKHRKQL